METRTIVMEIMGRGELDIDKFLEALKSAGQKHNSDLRFSKDVVARYRNTIRNCDKLSRPEWLNDDEWDDIDWDESYEFCE